MCMYVFLCDLVCCLIETLALTVTSAAGRYFYLLLKFSFLVWSCWLKTWTWCWNFKNTHTHTRSHTQCSAIIKIIAQFIVQGLGLSERTEPMNNKPVLFSSYHFLIFLSICLSINIYMYIYLSFSFSLLFFSFLFFFSSLYLWDWNEAAIHFVNRISGFSYHWPCCCWDVREVGYPKSCPTRKNHLITLQKMV